MTYEEAIKVLTDTRVMILKRSGTELAKVCSMAIEALEKQIPKKPVDCDGYYCPNCGARVDDDGRGYEQPYCMECGQAIKWGE